MDEQTALLQGSKMAVEIREGTYKAWVDPESDVSFALLAHCPSGVCEDGNTTAK